MKIGIIAEGVTDCAVLKNLLKAYRVDGSDIRELLPDSRIDATDRQLQYGGFSPFYPRKSIKNTSFWRNK